MSAINYELVYKVRAQSLRVMCPNNRRIGYENEARAKADKEHKATFDAIAKLFGSDDLEFTNVSCMASGIRGHVYHPASATKSIGKRKCIFCGCDDFD